MFPTFFKFSASTKIGEGGRKVLSFLPCCDNFGVDWPTPTFRELAVCTYNVFWMCQAGYQLMIFTKALEAIFPHVLCMQWMLARCGIARSKFPSCTQNAVSVREQREKTPNSFFSLFFPPPHHVFPPGQRGRPRLWRIAGYVSSCTAEGKRSASSPAVTSNLCEVDR